ncbi:MAG: hypothetical protein HWD59_12925 [Coxiellaceae bacterium]|nr:MAG: hypothetical protein HWD59_12925 [Coxiellaceae bacterium]
MKNSPSPLLNTPLYNLHIQLAAIRQRELDFSGAFNAYQQILTAQAHQTYLSENRTQKLK